ncbi:MAG: hypothetical protein IKF00_07265 [Solobacterium sp.]|nr:hypothetical protein [Solobacterium sp.]
MKTDRFLSSRDQFSTKKMISRGVSSRYIFRKRYMCANYVYIVVLL